MQVFVYYNLHKNCLSVKALEGEFKGRVVTHANAVSLTNARFKVSEAGRQRVLREKAKNVHAGVVGSLTAIEVRELRMDCGAHCSSMPSSAEGMKLATYNPYRFDSFVDKDSLAPLHSADTVVIEDKVIRYSLAA